MTDHTHPQRGLLRAVARAERERLRHDTSAPEYSAWAQMRHRCSSRTHKQFPDYGGRGIRVCSQWDDFKVFLRDVGTRPSAEHSLDRINNDGNYEPGNVRWATSVEQNNNNRGNRWITYRGETHTIAQWSRCLDLPYEPLVKRLNDPTWTVERAFSTPIKKRRANGDGDRWSEMAARYERTR